MLDRKTLHYPGGKLLSYFDENKHYVLKPFSECIVYDLDENDRYTGNYTIYSPFGDTLETKKLSPHSTNSGLIHRYDFDGNLLYTEEFYVKNNHTECVYRNTDRGNYKSALIINDTITNAPNSIIHYTQSGNRHAIENRRNGLQHGEVCVYFETNPKKVKDLYIFENGIQKSAKSYNLHGYKTQETIWDDVSEGDYITAEYLSYEEVFSTYKNNVETEKLVYTRGKLTEHRHSNKNNFEEIHCYSYSPDAVQETVIEGISWDINKKINRGTGKVYYNGQLIEMTEFNTVGTTLIRDGISVSMERSSYIKPINKPLTSLNLQKEATIYNAFNNYKYGSVEIYKNGVQTAKCPSLIQVDESKKILSGFALYHLRNG